MYSSLSFIFAPALKSKSRHLFLYSRNMFCLPIDARYYYVDDLNLCLGKIYINPQSDDCRWLSQHKKKFEGGGGLYYVITESKFVRQCAFNRSIVHTRL